MGSTQSDFCCLNRSNRMKPKFDFTPDNKVQNLQGITSTGKSSDSYSISSTDSGSEKQVGLRLRNAKSFKSKVPAQPKLRDRITMN